MEPIFDKLYQFTYKIPGMPLDCHQYLLLRDPAILFSVGSADMARDFLPKVKELLAGRPLKYLFISHREWDECGGLAVLHKMFPETIVICSQNAAGNFKFNDYDGKVIACTPGQPFTDGGLELVFLPYPVEPHYNLGLLAYEKNSGVFSSADLFLKGELERPGGCYPRELPEHGAPTAKDNSCVADDQSGICSRWTWTVLYLQVKKTNV